MYNGIGLPTPRGSGTSGHVQRNFAVVRKRDKTTVKDDGPDRANRQPNKDILEHARKRKLEVKCMEYADVLEEQGFTQEEIESKLESYRAILQLNEKDTVESVNPRNNVFQETHHIAEANLQKNNLLREAFGISKNFVDGTSFDPERREREAQLKAAQEKNYQLVRTPSPVAECEKNTDRIDNTKEKSKKLKRKKKSEKSKKIHKKTKKYESESSNSESDSSTDSDNSINVELKKSSKRKRNYSDSKKDAKKKKYSSNSSKYSKSRKSNSDSDTDASNTSNDEDDDRSKSYNSKRHTSSKDFKTKTKSRRSDRKASKSESSDESHYTPDSESKITRKKRSYKTEKKHRSRSRSPNSSYEAKQSKHSNQDDKRERSISSTDDVETRKTLRKRSRSQEPEKRHVYKTTERKNSNKCDVNTPKDSWIIEKYEKTVVVKKCVKNENNFADEFDIRRRSSSMESNESYEKRKTKKSSKHYDEKKHTSRSRSISPRRTSHKKKSHRAH